jgi:multidrug efflux pump subunit AcrA (membrane-fusion protein)
MVLSSVSATGNVASSHEVGLDFGSSGEVTEVLVQAGDTVKAGQVLARIDAGDAQAALDLAQANLTSAEAKLAEAKAGLTPAERAQLEISEEQAQAQVTSAERSLANARATADQDEVGLQNAVDQAKANIAAVKATTALNAEQYQASVDQATLDLATDQAQYATDQATLATATTTLAAAQAASDGASAKVTADQADKTYCAANPTLTGPQSGVACSDLDSQTVLDQAAQSRAGSALSDAKSAANTASSAVTSGKAKVAGDVTTLSAARSNQKAGLLKDQQSVANAETSYENAKVSQQGGLLKDQQSISNAETSLASAKLSLRATKAGDLVKLEPAKAAELASDEAQVIQARTALTSAQDDLGDTTLVAPADATVASVSGEVGDLVTGSSSSSSASSAAASQSSSSSSSTSGFVVLTDLRHLQVTAGFSEADAAKVGLGQAAIVTFDALPNAKASGKVVAVDGSSTVVNNVVTYDVTVLLTQDVPDVKAGMTASVQVVVDEKDGVLEVPSSAISTRGTQSTVTVRVGKEDEQRSVVVGLTGDDSTEVVSGLKEGDTVVTGGGTGATTTVGGAGANPGGTLTGGGGFPGAGGFGGGRR